MLCASTALVNGGPGVRFTVWYRGRAEPAFAIRHAHAVHAYLNRCAHKLVELDWEPGRFFDGGGHHLICATHGALYEPASGSCVAGPCRGAALVPLPVEERDGAVWLAGESGAMLK
jgi:nitrite reductase/ring-hydroxylating ferredoxin subunit